LGTGLRLSDTGPEFELLRVAMLPEGAFGVLMQWGIPFATTLERTYELAGKQQFTKIPTGIFPCRSRYYLRGNYDTYEVMEVPGHFALLFHKGNVENDSDGCILVGQGYGNVYQKPGVIRSMDGFHEFMRRTEGKPEFFLRVRQAT
jgi:uncharacterized protein DUF5675